MRSLLAGIALLLVPWLEVAAADAGDYSIAIVPQFNATRIQGDWQPLLDRVTATTGLRLTLVFTETIPEFETAFERGEPDFALLNPYHAVMARRAQGYVPLVRDETPLTGILVTRKDSPIQAAAELDGKEIAYPAPNAFGASLYMRALLAAMPGLRTTPVYVETHGNVYRRVAIGDFAAGGGIAQTLAETPPALRAQLRVIFETPPSAPHPLSAHPRVPESAREAVAEAILAMRADEAGRALLARARLPAPVRADYARDYEPLELLDIESFVVREQGPGR